MENKKIVPCRLTELPKQKIHVQLFLARKYDEKTSRDMHHYCLITNFQRLVSTQLTSNNEIFICERCINYFYSADKLKMHEEIWVSKTRMTFPQSPNNILKFKNFKNKLFNKLVVYSDSESLLEKCELDAGIKVSFQQHKL